MTLDDFRRSLQNAAAPPMPALLEALWLDAHGEWDAAHRVAQDVDTPDGSWVHAYLHRREGDRSNARYWYRRAGRPEATDALTAEWDRLAQHLLSLSDQTHAE